jgi:hypothetical protein
MNTSAVQDNATVWNCSDLQGRRRRSSDTRLRIDFKDAKEACRCVMLVSNLRSPKFWRLRHQYPPIWLQPRWLLLILATSRIPPVDRPHIEKWIGLRALKTLWNKVVFFVRFTQGQPTLIFYNTITWIASEQAHYHRRIQSEKANITAKIFLFDVQLISAIAS